MAERKQTKSADEIERKFLLDRRPAGLGGHPHDAIDQGYLVVGEDGTGVRLRRKGRRHFITVKSTYAGRKGARRETEVPITEKQFAALWPTTVGRRLSKTRYNVPVGRYTAEVDVYHGPLRGLMTVEVEFPSDLASAEFEPPEWFGRDVTDDARYLNQTLACKGRPPARGD